MAWDNIEWTPDSKTLWSTDLKCFVFEQDDNMDASEDSDSDWDPNNESECISSEDDVYTNTGIGIICYYNTSLRPTNIMCVHQISNRIAQCHGKHSIGHWPSCQTVHLGA
jgi:hypothetical protein